MEEMIYNVFHKTEWGLFIALYFYFTGISAGSCHYSSIYTLLKIEKYKPLAKYAALVALLGFLVTPILLIVDLGQPTRMFNLFNPSYFNVTSVMSWGTLLLTIYPVALILYVWLLYREDEHKAAGKHQGLFRAVSVAVLPLAVAVHAYTGFIFGVIQARAWWYTALQPLYFLMGAIISGFAIMLLFSIVKHKLAEAEISMDLVQTSRKLLAWVLVIYPLFIFSHIVMLLHGSADAVAAAKLALSEPVYLYGDILGGVLIPLVILVYPGTRTSTKWMTVAAVLALVGVLFARYSVVTLGQMLALS